jgi:hypothetical protein
MYRFSLYGLTETSPCIDFNTVAVHPWITSLFLFLTNAFLMYLQTFFLEGQQNLNDSTRYDVKSQWNFREIRDTKDDVITWRIRALCQPLHACWSRESYSSTTPKWGSLRSHIAHYLKLFYMHCEEFPDTPHTHTSRLVSVVTRRRQSG